MKKSLLFSLLALLVILLIAFLLRKGSSKPNFDSSLEELIYDMQYDNRFARSPFSGAILVSKGDSILYKDALSITEGKQITDITLDSRFCIGGLTKQFTATLALKLAEEGLLQLEAPIASYLPDFPKEKGEKITLHQLLSHTSGLPHYNGLDMEREEFFKKRISPEAFQELVANVELLFPPGKEYYYSALGYALAAVVLERVSGQTYSQLLSKYITEPLGLKNTGYAPPLPDSLLNDFVYKESNPFMQMINSRNGFHKETRQRDLSNAYAAAGMYSSLNDLHRWLDALRSGKVLSPASYELMFRPNKMGYCYGWYHNPDDLFRRNPQMQLYFHNGRIMNYRTMIALYEDGTTIITLSNVSPVSNTSMMYQLYLKAHNLDRIERDFDAPNLNNRKRFDEDGGLAALDSFYQELSRRAGYPMPPRQWVLGRLAGFGLSEEEHQWVEKHLQKND